jgi:tRNA 2-thiouridine synthesizing protein A
MSDCDIKLDTSGLLCPIPLLRLKKSISTMISGQVIMIITTDPAAHLDFGVFTEQAGHQIIECIKHSDRQIFYIKKK